MEFTKGPVSERKSTGGTDDWAGSTAVLIALIAFRHIFFGHKDGAGINE
jgi:hypothetical protein